MTRATIAALRVLLVLILLGALVAQLWFFPVLADQLRHSYPEFAWLQWPLLATVEAIIVGVQVGLIAIWRLLSMVETDSVFDPSAFKWVDVIIWAAVADAALMAGIWAVLSFGAEANPPGLMLTELALVVGGAAFALLMLVMKGLLRKASQLRVELSEVI